MQLVWCFSDIPSCCHHDTHSYSCALCSHCSISYFNVRSIFIPRYKIHSIKKNKKARKNQKPNSVCCLLCFLLLLQRQMNVRALQGLFLTCLTSCCSVRLQPFSALQPLNLSPHVSCSKSRNHRENWVSLAVVVAQINWACNVKSARGSSFSSVQSRVNFIKHGACDRQHSLQHRNAGLLCEPRPSLPVLLNVLIKQSRSSKVNAKYVFIWWSVLQAVTTAVQAEWLCNYQ